MDLSNIKLITIVKINDDYVVSNGIVTSLVTDLDLTMKAVKKELQRSESLYADPFHEKNLNETSNSN